MIAHRPLIHVIAGIFGLAAIALAPSHAAASTNDIENAAREFVAEMSDDAIDALAAAGMSREERIDRFRALFNSRFAVPVIGRWVLGRHWRKATAEEQDEYLVLFEDLMVASYVDRFARYTGESLTITRKRGVTVFSEIDRPEGGRAVRVDWRVANRGDLLKVVDVVVEGTSLSTTLRSDFSSIIRR